LPDQSSRDQGSGYSPPGLGAMAASGRRVFVRAGGSVIAPQVSVVIPTHNRRVLLVRTLRTVLWQREVDFETIVVDDGSTDDTADVVTRMADPRVRLLRHRTPQGVSAARNYGIDEARGRWKIGRAHV